MQQEAIDFIRTRGKGTLGLAAANLLVFLLVSVRGNTEDVSFMLRCGACYTPLILEGQYYRLITGMFLHFGLMHLLYNMISLVALGDLLEKEIGTARFLLVYFLGGIAGNLASLGSDLLLKGGGFTVSAGASGAVFAVIGALLIRVIARKGTPGSIPAGRMVLMTALMVLQGFTEKGTDNAAHVGGLIGGILLGLILGRRKPQRS